jgi:hypothetical protein
MLQDQINACKKLWVHSQTFVAFLMVNGPTSTNHLSTYVSFRETSSVSRPIAVVKDLKILPGSKGVEMLLSTKTCDQ